MHDRCQSICRWATAQRVSIYSFLLGYHTAVGKVYDSYGAVSCGSIPGIFDNDIAFYKAVFKDTSVPAHARAFAGHRLAIRLEFAAREQEALRACRRALALTISDEDRDRSAGSKPAGPYGPFVPTGSTAGEHFDGHMLNMRTQLDTWEKGSSQSFDASLLKPPPGLTDAHQQAQVAQLIQRITSFRSIPGSACDCCKAPAVPGVKLLRCAVCRRKCYCNKACQVQ